MKNHTITVKQIIGSSSKTLVSQGFPDKLKNLDLCFKITKNNISFYYLVTYINYNYIKSIYKGDNLEEAIKAYNSIDLKGSLV